MVIIVDPDPLLINRELPLEAEFYPLGFPLRLATNSTEVMDAAACAWRAFPPAFAVQPIELRVVAEPGDEPPLPPLFRAQRHLIVISGGANFAVCDHNRNFAFCRLNAAAAADGEFTRYYFLEAMALFTLTQLHVTPVHAACIARGGRALMLCGESGAGKSTLAYACARRGWTYISDNESWLLRSDGRTILGHPTRIRLRDTAAALFPELAGRPAVSFNGKRSIILDSAGLAAFPGQTTAFPSQTSAFPVLATAFQCRPERIIFLERDGRQATLAPVEGASERLLAGIIEYMPDVRAAHRASLERFTEIPALALHYTGLDDAIPALEGLVA
jgi:hypothetical protein